MTPPGEHYVPAWDDDEIALIREVLGTGLRIFRESVRNVSDYME